MGKVCDVCHLEKPLAAFYERQRARLHGKCIECWLEAQKQRRALQGAAAALTESTLRPLTREIVPIANRVLRASCARYGCALSAIRQHDKTAQVCEMRQVASYILSADLHIDYSGVAMLINHSRFTVRHSVEVVALAIQTRQPSAWFGEHTTVADLVREIRTDAFGDTRPDEAAQASTVAS